MQSNAKMPISVNSNPQAPSIFGRQQGWSDQVADAKMLKNGPVQPLQPQPQQHESVKFVHSTMEILENQIKREEAPKKKRTRTSTEQLRILQRAFATDPMPSSSARLALSKRLGMNPRAVQVWFQNRRAKEKLDARRAELGLTGATSFTDSNERGDLSDYEGGNDSIGASVDIEELGESSNEPESGSSNLFNSLRATGMMQRFVNHNSGSASTATMKTQRSASTPNGFMFNNALSSSASNGSLPFHQQQHQQQQQSSFFPASASTFLADVNEASVDDLYGELGTGSAASPTEVPLEFYGGLVVDRTPSVSPIGFGAGRGHLFSSPFGDDLLMSSVFPLLGNNAGLGIGTSIGIGNSHSTMANMSNMNTTLPNNSTITHPTHSTFSSQSTQSTVMRNPQAANVFLTAFPGQHQHQSQSTRRSHSLPSTHASLSPAQLQSLEHFGMQAFPSPLLSSIEEAPVGELLEGADKRVFNEFLENEVIR